VVGGSFAYLTFGQMAVGELAKLGRAGALDDPSKCHIFIKIVTKINLY
jgi:hypothetical protein